MYQLVSAIVKPLTGDGRWKNMDIGTLPLSQLFSEYRKVLTVLSNSFVNYNVSFDIEPLRAAYGSSPLTLPAFLEMNGNATLATSTTLPALNTRFAKYADAFHAGYKVIPTHPTASWSADMPLADKTWLRLQKTDVDYDLFYKNCLVNVNGFYHLTDVDSEAVYVVDGYKCARKSTRNEIGILSFRELGEITCIPITDAMIYTQKPEQKLRSNCYVETGEDLSNKTVMLVLGGYLHVLDHDVLSRVSASSFKIDFDNLSLLDRYYESKDVLDFSSLPLEHDASNPNHASLRNLYSDGVLRAYLKLPQTFLVVLDNANVFVDKDYLHPSKMPGVYSSATKPQYPIVLATGRHETAWYHYEKPIWSVHINQSLVGNPMSETVNLNKAVSVSDHEDTQAGRRNSPAFYLKIGADI
jgi:hypothetical protein